MKGERELGAKRKMGEPARSAAKTWVGDGKWVRARSAGESWVRQGDEQMELVGCGGDVMNISHSPDPFSYSKFHYLTLPNLQNFLDSNLY